MLRKRFSLMILFLLLLCYCNIGDSITRPINKYPTCQIINPVNNSSYSHDDSIKVIVEVRDEDVGVYSVKFFINDEFIYQDFAFPFECTHSAEDLTIGEPVIEAKAIDRSHAERTHSINVRIIYSYKMLEHLNDGWAISSLGAEGIDTLKICDLMYVIHSDYCFMHSIILIKNGRLIFEEYFNGYSKYSKHHIQSATKSFASALIGIAIDKGYINSVDTPIFNFFPG